MPIPDNEKAVVELTVKGTIAAGGSDATPVANVFHFRRTALSGAISKTNIKTAFDTAIVALLEAATNADVTFDTIEARYVNDALDPPTAFTIARVGDIVGDRAPSHAAVYMLLRTANKGRSYRGSKHFSPLSESDFGDDVLSGAGVTNWGALKDAILAGFTDSDGNVWIPVVLSRLLSTLGTNPTTVIATDVTAVLLNKTIGGMDRRRAATVR